MKFTTLAKLTPQQRMRQALGLVPPMGTRSTPGGDSPRMPPGVGPSGRLPPSNGGVRLPPSISPGVNTRQLLLPPVPLTPPLPRYRPPVYTVPASSQTIDSGKTSNTSTSNTSNQESSSGGNESGAGEPVNEPVNEPKYEYNSSGQATSEDDRKYYYADEGPAGQSQAAQEEETLPNRSDVMDVEDKKKNIVSMDTQAKSAVTSGGLPTWVKPAALVVGGVLLLRYLNKKAE